MRFSSKSFCEVLKTTLFGLKNPKKIFLVVKCMYICIVKVKGWFDVLPQVKV